MPHKNNTMSIVILRRNDNYSQIYNYTRVDKELRYNSNIYLSVINELVHLIIWGYQTIKSKIS